MGKKKSNQKPVKKTVAEQRTEKYNILKQAGYSSADAGKMRSWGYERINKLVREKIKEDKRTERNKRASRNNALMKQAGIPRADRERLRYASEETIEEILRTGQAQPKGARKRAYNKKYNGTDTLLVFWKDKTEGFVDEDRVKEIFDDYRKDSIEYLLKDIKGSLSISAGEIGTYQMVITDNPKGMKHFFAPEIGMDREWITVYEGQAQTYKPLVVLTAAMLMLLYDPFEDKYMFVMDLVQNVKHFNPSLAARLRRDIGLR